MVSATSGDRRPALSTESRERVDCTPRPPLLFTSEAHTLELNRVLATSRGLMPSALAPESREYVDGNPLPPLSSLPCQRTHQHVVVITFVRVIDAESLILKLQQLEKRLRPSTQFSRGM